MVVCCVLRVSLTVEAEQRKRELFSYHSLTLQCYSFSLCHKVQRKNALQNINPFPIILRPASQRERMQSNRINGHRRLFTIRKRSSNCQRSAFNENRTIRTCLLKSDPGLSLSLEANHQSQWNSNCERYSVREKWQPFL